MNASLIPPALSVVCEGFRIWSRCLAKVVLPEHVAPPIPTTTRRDVDAMLDVAIVGADQPVDRVMLGFLGWWITITPASSSKKASSLAARTLDSLATATVPGRQRITGQRLGAFEWRFAGHIFGGLLAACKTTAMQMHGQHGRPSQRLRHLVGCHTRTQSQRAVT